MKRYILLIAIIDAVLACNMPILSSEVQVTDLPPLSEPTDEPLVVEEDIEEPANSEPDPVAQPRDGYALFTDPEVGFALEYPADWYVQESSPGYWFLTSYEILEAGSGGQPEGEIKLDLIRLPAERFESLADFRTRILEEPESEVTHEAIITLPSGLEAFRWDAIAYGELSGLYTVINGQGVQLVGFGDLSRFDDVALTIRLLP